MYVLAHDKPEINHRHETQKQDGAYFKIFLKPYPTIVGLCSDVSLGFSA